MEPEKICLLERKKNTAVSKLSTKAIFRESIIVIACVGLASLLTLGVVFAGNMQSANEKSPANLYQKSDNIQAHAAEHGNHDGISEDSEVIQSRHGKSDKISVKVSASSPHIIYFLLDDVGYNDLNTGHNSTDLSHATPHITGLARKGVSLTRFYTEPSCSPGRSSLLSGKFPATSGMSHSMVFYSAPWGLPLEHTLLPQVLKVNGYRTAMVGKWDIGHYSKKLWPTNRGFHTFFGILQTAVNYYTYICCSNGTTPYGYDLRDGEDNAGEYFGNYSTDLFAQRAVSIINGHNATIPLFLYVAFNAPHAPVLVETEFEKTVEYTNLTSSIPWSKRKTYAGAIYLIDRAVGWITDELASHDMMQDVVVVVSSDNGAPSSAAGGENGGSNWPLRGYKSTVYEGAIRVPCVVYSPLIPEKMRGRSSDNLMHAADWYATLVEGVLGVPAGDIDSVSQWDFIMGSKEMPPRTELPIKLDYLEYGYGAYIVGQYKILHEACYAWYNVSGQPINMDGIECDDDTSWYRMYNVIEDPSEVNDLYGNESYASIQAELEEKYCAFYKNSTVDLAYRNPQMTRQYEAMKANDMFVTEWDSNGDLGLLQYPKSTGFLESDFCVKDAGGI